MIQIYTHENRLFVCNAKNLLEAEGIELMLKNEYAAGAAGDLAPIDAWMELWLINERDYTKAKQIIHDAFEQPRTATWVCSVCQEHNPASFEICWSCQSEPRF